MRTIEVRRGATATPLAQHLLVVANETLAGDGVSGLVDDLTAADAEVLVVCPVLVGRARYWTSDLGAGIDDARDRLEDSLAALDAHGIDAEGIVGDGTPLLAIEDALRAFPADRVLVLTHPPEHSRWLERRLIERTRARFDLPVSHAIVSI
jgi:nucleotide-binding universal stress UspA family protein